MVKGRRSWEAAFRLSDIPRVDEAFGALRAATSAALRSVGATDDESRIERSVDLRYERQSYELTVAADEGTDPVNSFHEFHASRYGYRHSHRPLELVTARVRAVGLRNKPPLLPSPTRGRRPPMQAVLRLADAHTAHWPTGDDGAPTPLPTPAYDRAALHPGNGICGPALVCEYSATTAIPPGWRRPVDGFGGLLLRRS